MSDGYLMAMAVALTSGADAALTAASLGAALTGVLASQDLAEGLVLNEVAEASADAAEECYTDAGIDLVDIINGPDPCPACLALAESNPHEPGLIPAHPRCECSEAPYRP